MSVTFEIQEYIDRVLTEKIDPLKKEISELREKIEEVDRFANFANSNYESAESRLSN